MLLPIPYGDHWENRCGIPSSMSRRWLQGDWWATVAKSITAQSVKKTTYHYSPGVCSEVKYVRNLQLIGPPGWQCVWQRLHADVGCVGSKNRYKQVYVSARDIPLSGLDSNNGRGMRINAREYLRFCPDTSKQSAAHSRKMVVFMVETDDNLCTTATSPAVLSSRNWLNTLLSETRKQVSWLYYIQFFYFSSLNFFFIKKIKLHNLWIFFAILLSFDCIRNLSQGVAILVNIIERLETP